MTSLKEIFSRVCYLLNEQQVDYIVIGGIAVANHGFPRNTSDIDFWYDPTNQNFLNIIKIFEELGVDVSSLNEVTFDPKKSFLRFPVHGVNIEFLPSILGLTSFADAKRKAKHIELDGTRVPILSLDHLIENKIATNRPIDKIDVEELKRKRKPD